MVQEFAVLAGRFQTDFTHSLQIQVLGWAKYLLDLV